jgi:hypothetical protein
LIWASPANSGTVTSVAVAAGSNKVTVSGSPITGSGTITVDVDTTKMDVSTMTGTLGTGHGGTGLTTIGTAKQILRVNAGATGLEYAALAASDMTGLATVATSGSYTDLTNKPSIPAAQVNSDWNASSGVAQILNKPTFAAVATSGAYSDLTGTPAAYTLPTASGSVLGGIKVGSGLAIDGSGVLSATGGGGTGSNPTNSTAPGWFQFKVTLNTGGTATSAITNLPTGWTAVDGGSGVITVTHNVGTWPTSATMFGSTTATAGPFKVRNADQTSSGGSFQVPDSGSFTPSITQFLITVTSATAGSVGNGTVFVKVTF